MSARARHVRGSRTPGRYAALERSRRSRRRASRRRPTAERRDRCERDATASAVPQLPEPSTAIGLIAALPFAARSRRAAGGGSRDDGRGSGAGATSGQRPRCGARPTATPPAAARPSRRPSRVTHSASARRSRGRESPAIGCRDRREHAEHASRHRNPFAAVEPQPDRIDVPDDRRRSGDGHKVAPPAIACARRTAAAPLATRASGRPRRACARGPHHVGGADVAAPGDTDVDPASAPAGTRTGPSPRGTR